MARIGRSFPVRPFTSKFLRGNSVNYSQNLSDSVTSSDAFIKSLVLGKSDSTTQTDSIINQVTLFKADTATSSDIVTLTKGDLTDVITDHQSFTLVIHETLTPSDIFTDTATFIKSLADSITSTDAKSNIVTLYKTDTTSSTDVVSNTVTLHRLDSVLTDDTVARYLNGSLVKPPSGPSVILLLDGRIAIKISPTVYLPL